MGRSSQPRDRNGRWTTTGRGASLGSQRQDFAKALQHGPKGDNSGRSTVYAYLRDKDSPSGKAGSPYYVGVAGSVGRPYESHRRTPVPSDERRIRMLRSNLTHEQAREWEKQYIATFGRKDNHTGRQMLINRTDGGEGAVNPSRGIRAKQSEANRGKVPSAETRAKIGAANKGRPKSAETLALMSANAAGRTHSAETRARMSASHAGRQKPQDAVRNVAASRIRNTAAKYGYDPDRYAALTPNQRNALRMRRQAGKRGEDLFRGL